MSIFNVNVRDSQSELQGVMKGKVLEELTLISLASSCAKSEQSGQQSQAGHSAGEEIRKCPDLGAQHLGSREIWEVFIILQ